MLRHSRLRPAALYLVCSMAILVVWPFTEAGRFLIPLVPLNLAAFALGLESIGFWLQGRCVGMSFSARVCGWIVANAPVAVVLAAFPFGVYTGLKPWLASESPIDTRFDAACRWIEGHLPAEAVISARHPGDVFWRTGRKAVAWPAGESAASAASEIRSRGAGYVLVDLGRYVGEDVPQWLVPQSGDGESKVGSKRESPEFRQVAEPEPGMRVYEVRGGGESPR